MPHRSGSHHSSHHSHHRYRHHHSNVTSSSNQKEFGNIPFLNAYRYISINPLTKHIRYAYSSSKDYRLSQDIIDKFFLSFFICIFLEMFILFMGFNYAFVLSIPDKLVDKHESKIEDNLDILTAEEPLYAMLSDFREITGIPVVIETIDYSVVSINLEHYALERYKELFDSSENCWLLVLCKDGDNLSLMGMQGDNTDSFISGLLYDRFEAIFYKEYDRNHEADISLIRTFNSVSFEPHRNYVFFIVLLLPFIWIPLTILSRWRLDGQVTEDDMIKYNESIGKVE